MRSCQREVALDYGLLGDALMEQGRLTEAAAAYQRMVDLKPFYQSYTRAAHARWMRGDLDGAIGRCGGDRISQPARPGICRVGLDAVAAYELQADRLADAPPRRRRCAGPSSPTMPRPSSRVAGCFSR